MRRRTLLVGALALIGASAGGYSMLRSNELDKAKFYSADGIALGGTDPVAYFTQNKPTKGSSEFAVEWQGTTWYFASAEHRDLFTADPAAYAPQYGGFCAWGLAAKGGLYSTDPDAWHIENGKLYLNYNRSVQERWAKDIPGFIEVGDRRWPEILTDG